MPHFIYRTLFYCFSRPCYNDDAGLSLAGEGPRQQSARKEPTPAGRKNRGLPFPFRAAKKKEDPMKKSLRSLLAFLCGRSAVLHRHGGYRPQAQRLIHLYRDAG